MTQIPDPREPWRPILSPEEPVPPVGDGVLADPPRPPSEPLSKGAGKGGRRRRSWHHMPDTAPEEASDAAWRQRDAREQLLTAAVVTLLVGGAALIYHFGVSHAARVIAADVPLLVTVYLVLGPLAMHSSWTRWRLVGASLLAAVVMWCVVPTFQGNSLASAAWRYLELKRLGPEQSDAFVAGRGVWAAVWEDFPSWKSRFARAEQLWVRRWWQYEMERIAELEGKPFETLDQLRALRDRCSAVGGVGEEQLRRLMELRRDAMRLSIADEESVLRGQLAKGRFASVFLRVNAMLDELGPECEELGCSQELLASVTRLRTAAVEEHLTLARLELERLLQRGALVEVAERGQELAREIAPGAIPANLMERVSGELEGPRRAALRARMKRGRQELEDRVGKKDWVGVGVTARQQIEEMKEEAALVRLERDLYDSLAEPRRVAVRARLEQAREELRSLQGRDRVKAIGELREQVRRELSGESKALKLEREVERFDEACRVFAELTRKARIEDRK